MRVDINSHFFVLLVWLFVAVCIGLITRATHVAFAHDQPNCHINAGNAYQDVDGCFEPCHTKSDPCDQVEGKQAN